MMVDSVERPIFVVGAQRSGTTMLRYMLCGHPRLYIPPESNFIPRFFSQQPTVPLSPEEAIRSLDQILSYRMFFRDWRGEALQPVTFIETLPDLKPATLLDALYTQYANQFGAQRWGDKSPIYTGHLDMISQMFPSFQVIHIVRDGRDVALSMLKSYRGPRFFYVDLAYATHSWKRRVREARSSGNRLGTDRYHEVRYEHLVANPEKVLLGICEYLGESHVLTMAEPHRMAGQSHHSKGIHAATLKPPSTQSSGRWRKEMSKRDQRLVQAIAGDLLEELGYETASLGRMNLREKARYLQLQSKYFFIVWARRTLQTAGLFHPTALLEHRLRSGKKSRP